MGGPADIEWSTLPDFGVLATDGFESGSTSGIRAGTIVESHGVPALSGQKMLRVLPGASTLLHLAAVPGAKHVLLDIRVLNECSYRGFKTGIAVKAGVIGSGAQTLQVEVDSTTTVTVGGISFGVGELRSLAIPLPPVEGDVLVQLLGPYHQGSGCERAGALVDNVRLE